MSRQLRYRVGLTSITLVAVLALAIVCAPPPDLAGLASHPNPARGYAAGMQRAAILEARDTPDVSPACRTRLYTHGVRTHDVLVLMHGLTNCPKQFDLMGRRFHARGWNVVIARIPHHGLADRMTGDLGRLDAGELARYTDEVVDVAAGLGERVTVAGLSLGGVAAAWAGQERADVDRAVAIAPLFGVARVPRACTAALAWALLVLPDRWVWWDAEARETIAGPPQVYPRFSTRALGETLRFGFAVRLDAARRPPAARELVIVSIGGDPAVNNGAMASIASLWRRAHARVETYEFPARLRLNHDLVDPEQVGARIDVVYPELERLLSR